MTTRFAMAPLGGGLLALLILAVLIVAVPPPSRALPGPEEPPPEPAETGGEQRPDPDKLQWALGLGVVQSARPYREMDDELIPVPVVFVRWKRLAFEGIGLSIRLTDPETSETLEVRALAKVRFDGYDTEDSRFLRGMEDREGTMDLGFDLTWEPGPLGLEVEAVTDALDRSGGQEVAATVFYPIRRRRVQVSPYAGAAWVSSSFTDYYYGVRPDEARPGRPAVSPGAAVNLDAGLEVLAFLRRDRRLILRGEVRLERLADEIVDSPIVDDRFAPTAFVALAWSFSS